MTKPNDRSRELQHLYVLPVLLLEFLALSITRAVIPTLLLQAFNDNVYFVMGCAECVRGLLAFVSCPAFGKISDVLGRRACLFVTVLGTCAPVCSLAVMSLQNHDLNSEEERVRVQIFVVLLALSGFFSSTFTLTFAYISDTVRRKKDRVTAYGLALATFGLSFTIGPMAGGYLALVEDESVMSVGDLERENDHYLHPIGQKRVFCTALVLTALDLLYIYFILPESVQSVATSRGMNSPFASPFTSPNRRSRIEEDDISIMTTDTGTSLTERWNVVTNAWSPFDTLRIFSGDPFMYEVGYIAFLYYTSLWAVVSTLTLYAAKRFQMGPERLGELMSALGLSTMISEAVLVRIVVPSIGEKKSMRIGLAAFAIQCIVLGFAYEGWQLFICVLLSTVANLVYPSLTSLVSSSVAPEMVGEALGAINGVKALTEGVGPLLFGTLMTFSEKTVLPGWPYLLASFFAIAAYKRGARLPDDDDEDYLSERYIHMRKAKPRSSNRSSEDTDSENKIFSFLNKIIPSQPGRRAASALSEIELENSRDAEYEGLLSEVEQVDEGELLQRHEQIASDLESEKCSGS